MVFIFFNDYLRNLYNILNFAFWQCLKYLLVPFLRQIFFSNIIFFKGYTIIQLIVDKLKNELDLGKISPLTNTFLKDKLEICTFYVKYPDFKMLTISSKIYTILSGFPIVDQIYVCSLLVYNFWAWRYWKRVPALIWQHSLYCIYFCCNLLSFLWHCFPFCPIDQARVKEMNMLTSLLLIANN